MASMTLPVFLGSASAEGLLSKAPRRNSRFASLNTPSSRRQQESFSEFPVKVSLCLLLGVGDLAISESIVGTRGTKLVIGFAQFHGFCSCPIPVHRPKAGGWGGGGGEKWSCKRKQELLENKKTTHARVVKQFETESISAHENKMGPICLDSMGNTFTNKFER